MYKAASKEAITNQNSAEAALLGNNSDGESGNEVEETEPENLENDREG